VPSFHHRSFHEDEKQNKQAVEPVVLESLGEAGDYSTEELRAIIAAEFVANEIRPRSRKWPLRDVIGAVLVAGVVLWALIFWVARHIL